MSHRRVGISAIAALMILFGFTEASMAFTHLFFGVRIASDNIGSFAGAPIGVLYAAAGLLVLTMKKFAVAGAIALLVLITAGRIVLILVGLYPIDTTKQIVALGAGTAIAAGFTVYNVLQWHRFN